MDESEIVLTLEDLEEASYKEYEAGGYSPPRITDPDKLLELRVSQGLACVDVSAYSCLRLLTWYDVCMS